MDRKSRTERVKLFVVLAKKFELLGLSRVLLKKCDKLGVGTVRSFAIT